MPNPATIYPEDLTGTAPTNLIVNEQHVLGVTVVRVIVPDYGPFFTESVILKDAAFPAIPLVKGTDYKCVELSQDLGGMTGKEVASVILVYKQGMSANTLLTYQTPGGYFVKQSAAVLRDLYDAVISDSRPVQWENVLNPPLTYPPNLHPHMMADIYRFQTLLVGLERIQQALTLSNVPAFERAMTYMKEQRDLVNTAGATPAVSQHNLSSLAHPELRSWVAGKFITEETVVNVNLAPNLNNNEFGSLQDAWDYIAKKQVHSKVTIRLAAGSYFSPEIYLNGINSNQQKRELEPLIYIKGGSGRGTDKAVLFHQVSPGNLVARNFVCVYDSSVDFSGILLSGVSPARNLGLVEYTHTTNSYTNACLAGVNSTITFSHGQPILDYDEEPFMTSGGVHGVHFDNCRVHGKKVTALNWVNTGITTINSHTHIQVIKSEGMVWAWNEHYKLVGELDKWANGQLPNYQMTVILGDEGDHKFKLIPGQVATMDFRASRYKRRSDRAVIVYGGLLTSDCVRTDKCNIAITSIDNGYIYLGLSVDQGRKLHNGPEQHGDYISDIRAVRAAFATGSGGVITIDTEAYSLDMGWRAYAPIDEPVVQNPKNRVRVGLGGVIALADTGGSAISCSGRIELEVDDSYMNPGFIGIYEIDPNVNCVVMAQSMPGSTITLLMANLTMDNQYHASNGLTYHSYGIAISVRNDHRSNFRRAPVWMNESRVMGRKACYGPSTRTGNIVIGWVFDSNLDDDIQLGYDTFLGNWSSGSYDVPNTTGYVKYPNGMIKQWGTTVIPAATGVNVTFPVIFPNKCIGVIVMGTDGNTANAYTANPLTVNGVYGTSYERSVWTLDNFSDHGTENELVRWMAEGY